MEGKQNNIGQLQGKLRLLQNRENDLKEQLKKKHKLLQQAEQLSQDSLGKEIEQERVINFLKIQMEMNDDLHDKHCLVKR